MTLASGLLTDPVFGHRPIRALMDDAAVTDAMFGVEIALARGGADWLHYGVTSQVSSTPLSASASASARRSTCSRA